MKWRLLFGLTITALFFVFAELTVAANSSVPNWQTTSAKLLRRCETNYDDDEIQAMRDDGEDMYEPDDCPLLAHVLTGPMTLNSCQGGDEDWVRFKARAGLIYQIRAEPRWNYPTEPHLDLYDDGNLVGQNDHYFDRNAEVWWWNNGGDRWMYLRVTELRGRHDCGNDAYTLTLNAFSENPYPEIIATPMITMTLTPMPTLTTTIIPTNTMATTVVTSTPTAVK